MYIKQIQIQNYNTRDKYMTATTIILLVYEKIND